MRTIVLKVGGSLYDLPDLGVRIAALLSPYREDRFLVFPGGGAAADLVRGWQPHFEWTDVVAHHIAIASLDFNAVMLANVLSRASVVKDRAAAEECWRRGELPVLAPAEFLRASEFGELPSDWTVTSDSLAAWTTLRWPADELWFGKSVPRPDSLTDAVKEGVVDPCFESLSERMPIVKWLNLRLDADIRTWHLRQTVSDETL